MKMTADEFRSLDQKSITLIGMSGVGKTYLSQKLSETWGWHHLSCDYQIGHVHMSDHLPQGAGLAVDDISSVSRFLGKIGASKLDGFGWDEFVRRQRLYGDAECAALRDVLGAKVTAMQNSHHFIHDSTGSFCEVEDQDLIARVGQETLLVYLVANSQTEKEVLQRAQEYPKPLFFPEIFLKDKIEDYLKQNDLAAIDEIVPDDFSRWIFPFLFEARKPKYQRLADQYGVAIPAEEFLNLSSEEDFINIIANHLD